MFAAPARYNIVPIPPPAQGDWRYGSGVGINDHGDVLVQYLLFLDPAGQTQMGRAYVYSDGGGLTELPWPAGLPWPDTSSVVGAGINNNRQVAVYGGSPASRFQSYRYTPGQGYLPLGGFGGLATEAVAINNRGQMTGFSEAPDGRSHAFRFTDGVGLEDITPKFTVSRGFGINDWGWVAGYGDGRAFLFRNDQGLIDLGPGRAYAVNNSGTVVGESWVVPGEPGFVYKDGRMVILSDEAFSQPWLFAINNADVAVGVGDIGSAPHSLLWTEAEGLMDLNSLIPQDTGWYLTGAVGINDKGQVVSRAWFQGRSRPVRLDPVPVPVLRISLVGTNAVLSWEPYWRQLVLEASDALSPSEWHAVPGGETSPVVLPACGAARYFRLNDQPAYGPTLRIVPAGAALLISWTPETPGYALEFTDSLSAPVWTPVLGGASSPVTVPRNSGPSFFRLRK